MLYCFLRLINFIHGGTGLDANQASPGIMSQFNMYSTRMDGAAAVNSGTCGNNGDIVDWDNIKEQGSRGFGAKAFPAC